MVKHLAILLWATDPDHPQRCSTPFFHAATAAAMDTEVEIYFTSRSVRLLVKGVAESLFTGPLQRETVYTFMRHAAEHGVRFYACNEAMVEHGVAADDLIPEFAGVAGAAAYMGRCLDEDWRSLVY